MKLKNIILPALLVAAFLPQSASAITVAYSGTYTLVAGSYTPATLDPPITGTITVGGGSVTGADLVTVIGSSNYNFDSVQAQGLDPMTGDYVLDLQEAADPLKSDTLQLFLISPATLFSGLGATIDTTQSQIIGYPGGFDVSTDITGTFVVASAVPEPSTWALMILGFFGIGAMTYRRRMGAIVAA
jgi:hypothetical protein